MDYRKEFLKALDYSEQKGFAVPMWCQLRPPLEIIPCLNPTTRTVLDNLFDKLMKESGPPLFIGQCMNVSRIVFEWIKRLMGSESAITLGWVEDRENKLFRFTSDDLDRWIGEGISDPLKMNIHVWITLPGLEIVDFSLPVSINHFDSSYPSIPIIDRWEKSRYRYHPIAVCNDFPRWLGLKEFHHSF